MPYTPSAADVAAALAAAYLVKRFLSRANPVSPLPLPPGPTGLPFIGNTLDLPQTQPQKAYVEWAQKYGPIIHVSVLGQAMIIVNDIAIATELLERRTVASSERPTLTMTGVLSGWDNILTFVPYGAHWRTQRRYFHAFVGAHAVARRHSALLERAARQMALRIMHAPKELEEGLRVMAGSVILRVTYGYETKAEHDPLVTLVMTAMKQFSDMSDPRKLWAVDLFPILKHIPAWFPGAGFKRMAAHYMDTVQKMAQVPFDAVKTQMSEGSVESSMVADLLAQSDGIDDESNIKWAAASMYAGGAETTVSTLATLFLCLTLFPNVQEKAQAELDAVVGRARLPTLADRPNLPYIDAVVSEALRWSPVVPTGISHKLKEDGVYGGYRLPAGSLVVTNIWAMLHDPAVYAKPDVFAPERFLASEGKPAEPDPRASFFGFGRRVCPGRALADASIWATTAVVLATLSVSKARDGFGAEITPEGRYMEGTVVHPEPFECDIKPRSAQVEALVAHELAQYECGRD